MDAVALVVPEWQAPELPLPPAAPALFVPDIGVMLFCRLVLLLFDELFCSRGVSLHSGQLP